MRIDLLQRNDHTLALKGSIEDLDHRLHRGDLTPKRHARAKQDLLVQLGRSTISPLLAPGESILAEHHWTEAQQRLPDSPFKETGQRAGSLYATQRRIFHWQFHIPGVPGAETAEAGEEVFEYRWYEEIARVERRTSIRWGEAAAGVVIGLAAAVLRQHLSLTGFILMGVGAFGIVHALLVPTRWANLVSAAPGGEPWPVYAGSTRSGCAILKEVEGRIPHGRG